MKLYSAAILALGMITVSASVWAASSLEVPNVSSSKLEIRTENEKSKYSLKSKVTASFGTLMFDSSLSGHRENYTQLSPGFDLTTGDLNSVSFEMPVKFLTSQSGKGSRILGRPDLLGAKFLGKSQFNQTFFLLGAKLPIYEAENPSAGLYRVWQFSLGIKNEQTVAEKRLRFSQTFRISKDTDASQKDPDFPEITTEIERSPVARLQLGVNKQVSEKSNYGVLFQSFGGLGQNTIRERAGRASYEEKMTPVNLVNAKLTGSFLMKDNSRLDLFVSKCLVNQERTFFNNYSQIYDDLNETAEVAVGAALEF